MKKQKLSCVGIMISLMISAATKTAVVYALVLLWREVAR